LCTVADTTYSVYYSTNGKTFTNTLNIPMIYNSSYSEAHIECYVCTSQVLYISDEQDGNPASWIGFYNTTTWTLMQNYVGIESHTDMWLIFDKNNLILRQGEGGGVAQMYVIRASSVLHWMTASVSSYAPVMNVSKSQTITCTVTGGIPPYTYQWYLNGTKIAGATSSSYVFTPSSTGHCNFYVNVTDSEYYATNPNTYNLATSNTVTVVVQDPGATAYPSSATLDARQSITLGSSASGRLITIRLPMASERKRHQWSN
jgi:hypothetical protein